MDRRALASSCRRRLLAGLRPLLIAFAAVALILIARVPAAAQRASDFTLNDLAGQAWSLYRSCPDKVVLIDFWATWCVPCVKELPHLQRFQDAYGEKGLQVVTISIDGPDSVADVSAFVARYHFSFPVLLDTESRVVSVYNPSLLVPHSVLVDRSGVIRHVHQGYSPGDERLLEQKILALLEEPPVKPKSVISVRVNESSLLRLPEGDHQRAHPEDVYTESLNQVDVTVSKGGLLAAARVDVNVDLSPVDSRVGVEKRYVEYAAKRVRARAGDFYTSLGRGLVFSMVKVFEEEGLDRVVDTTVDGGQASFATNRFGGNLFGGWVDRPADASIHDTVGGFAAGTTWPGVGTVRVQGVTADLQPGGEFRIHRAQTGSVSLELPELGGRAALYGEFSLMRRETYRAEAPVSGHGLYVGSKLRAGRLSLLFELKNYRQLDFEFAHPPLLESEELDILADQFDVDRTDVLGYSARVDYFAPASQTLIYAKYLGVDDDPEDDPVYGAYDRRIGHVLAGIEKKFSGGGYVNALAGWRHEDAAPDYFPLTDGGTVHDQVNASWPLGGRWSVEGDWKHKKFDGDSASYSEIRASLSLHRSPNWVVSALYERTTNPAVVYVSGKRDYWAGQLELRLGSHSVRAFVGATKGSMKCAGGVCRVLPAFEGVRVEAFLRF
jgi:peroxiredoxin